MYQEQVDSWSYENLMCKSNVQLAMCSSSQRVEERKLCNDMKIIESNWHIYIYRDRHLFSQFLGWNLPAKLFISWVLDDLKLFKQTPADRPQLSQLSHLFSLRKLVLGDTPDVAHSIAYPLVISPNGRLPIEIAMCTCFSYQRCFFDMKTNL